MVPLKKEATIRHHFTKGEIRIIINGLFLLLEDLNKKRDDKATAKQTFKVLHQLMYKQVGRPKKLEFSWDEIDNFLNIYTGTEEM